MYRKIPHVFAFTGGSLVLVVGVERWSGGVEWEAGGIRLGPWSFL
jgi:hypothetical protein